MSECSIWGTLSRAGSGVDVTLSHVHRTSAEDLRSAVTEPDRLAHLEGLESHVAGPEGALLPWDAGRFDELLPA